MNVRIYISVILLFLTVGLGSYGANLTANVASIDITPPIEMKYTLGGYGERQNKPAISCLLYTSSEPTRPY